MALSDNIKTRRTQLKMSQEYVADQLGISRQAVAKWESGKSRPTAANLAELAALFEMSVSELVDPEKEKEKQRIKEEKTEMLLRHGIALYDVVERCTIVGSSDSSIKDVVPVDLTPILEQTGNIPIFANGATAEKLYRKYLFPKTGISAVKLPSTSPANAAWSLSRLEEAWREAMEPYLG